MGRTIGKIGGPRPPLRCQRNEVTEGRVWPGSSNNRVKARPDLQPPEIGGEAVPAPHTVPLAATSPPGWPGARWLQLRLLPGATRGGGPRSRVAAGRPRPDQRKLFAHLKGGCAQEKQLKKNDGLARLSARSARRCSLVIKSLRRHLLVLIII